MGMESKKTDGLTYERAIEIFRYDGETGVLERRLKNGEWRLCGHKPIHGDGYGMVGIDGKVYLTHRVIWLLVHKAWPENAIDHIDRNPMNNKISNLREVSKAENQHNADLRRDNSSGYIGVSFHKCTGKYQAQICLNGKNINLGLFNTTEEAYLAYQLAKIKYHPTSPVAQEYLRELTLAG